MKVADVLQALQTFFFDFIGAVIPGSILLVGSALTLGALDGVAHVVSELGDFAWAGLLIATYTLGNVAVGAGGYAVARWQKTIQGNLLNHPAVTAFQRAMQRHLPPAADDAGSDAEQFSSLRNLALSVIDAGTALTHRFMFIALFHLGTAAAITISTVAFWVSLPIRALNTQGTLEEVDWWAAGLGSVLVVLVVVLLLRRWNEFYRRSMRVPFSTALAHLVALEQSSATADASTARPSEPRSAWHGGPVYLAGGFRSGWQDVVMERVSHLPFFDPRSHSYQDERQYTAWDLQAIRQSATVFAYAEASNPGLYALALEVGYAKALGKHIILVEQHPDEQRTRYFGMLRACADVRVTSLDEAINFLHQATSPNQPAPDSTPEPRPPSRGETVETVEEV